MQSARTVDGRTGRDGTGWGLPASPAPGPVHREAGRAKESRSEPDCTAAVAIFGGRRRAEEEGGGGLSGTCCPLFPLSRQAGVADKERKGAYSSLRLSIVYCQTTSQRALVQCMNACMSTPGSGSWGC